MMLDSLIFMEFELNFIDNFVELGYSVLKAHLSIQIHHFYCRFFLNC